MSRAPLYALTAAIALIAAISTVADPQPTPASAEVAPAPRFSNETPSTGAVLAGAVEASVLTDIEADLTEEAANRSQDLHWISFAKLAGCNPIESEQWSILANQHFATLFDSPVSSEKARRHFRFQFNQHLSDAQVSCRLTS